MKIPIKRKENKNLSKYLNEDLQIARKFAKSMHQELVEGLKSNSYQPVDFDKFNPKPPYIADIENSGPINHYVLVRENDIINDGVVSKLEKEDHISLYIVIRKN